MGAYYWYVKIPQCGYMEHGFKDIAYYVHKRIVPRAVCYNFPLVRDKPLGAPAFVRRVYFFSFHLNRPCPGAIPEIQLFKIWPWKSRAKVMDEVKVTSHKGYKSYRLTCLRSMSIGHPIPMWFLGYGLFKIWPCISIVKVITPGPISYPLTSFSSRSIGLRIPEIWLSQNLTLKIQGQDHGWG